MLAAVNFVEIADALVLLCLVAAAALSVAAGIGLLRFRNTLSRLHSATKPQILGLLLVLVALALNERSWVVLGAVVPVFIFQLLTAPVAAHMVSRAVYRTGQVSAADLLVDELGPAVARAPKE